MNAAHFAWFLIGYVTGVGAVIGWIVYAELQHEQEATR